MGLDEVAGEEPVKVDSRAVLAEEMKLDPGKKYAVAFDFEQDEAAVAAEEIFIVKGIASLRRYLDGEYAFVVYDEKSALHALSAMDIRFSACTDDIMLMAYIAAVSDNDFRLTS